MIRRKLSDDGGFSLVEIAVAIVVLGIILVGLFPFVVDSVRLAAKNAEVAQANRIAATQLDAARNELSTAVSCPAASATALPLSVPVLSNSESAKFTVTSVANCDAVRLARVSVTVVRNAEPGKTVASAVTKVVTAS